MEDHRCRQYFLEPQETFQRRYEALRAVVVDGQSLTDVAEHFGFKVSALRSLVSRFRAARRRDLVPPFFSPTAGDVPPDDAVARTSTAPCCPRSPTAGN
jgi:Helix-turn-helix domain